MQDKWKFMITGLHIKHSQRSLASWGKQVAPEWAIRVNYFDFLSWLVHHFSSLTRPLEDASLHIVQGHSVLSGLLLESLDHRGGPVANGTVADHCGGQRTVTHRLGTFICTEYTVDKTYWNLYIKGTNNHRKGDWLCGNSSWHDTCCWRIPCSLYSSVSILITGITKFCAYHWLKSQLSHTLCWILLASWRISSRLFHSWCFVCVWSNTTNLCLGWNKTL